MACPVIASWTTNDSGASTTTALTLTKPGSVAVGDLLLLLVGSDDASASPNWNTVAGWTRFVSANDNVADADLACYWRIADGSEDATIEITAGSADERYGWYLRVTGAHASSPIHVVGTPQATGSANPHVVDEIETTVADCLAFYVLAWDGGDVGSFAVAGAGWAEVDEVITATASGDAAGCWGTKDMGVAGWTGDATVTTGNSDGATRVQFAISPPYEGSTIVVNPPDSIADAIASAVGSDTVQINAGTYSQSITVDGRDFAEGNELTIVANGSVTIENGIYLNASSYIIIDGFSVTGTVNDNGGIFLYDADFCTVRNCTVSTMLEVEAQAGCRSKYCNETTFSNIIVTGCARGFENTHATGVLWEDCEAWDCDETPSDSDGFVCYSDQGLAAYNAFVRCISDGNGDDGFDMWNGSKALLIDCEARNIGPWDGNGIKLGGTYNSGPHYPGNHIVIGCLAEDNAHVGITTNSGPNGSLLIACESYNNVDEGFEEWDDSGGSVFYNCIATGNDPNWDIALDCTRDDNYDVTVNDLPAWLDDAECPARIKQLAIDAINALSDTVDTLTADNLAAGAPVTGTPAIGQIHRLTATATETQAPALGSPTIGQAHALVADATDAQAPVLGAPELGQAHALTTSGVTAGAPLVDSPTLAQIHALVASGAVAGAPLVDSPAIGQSHTLTATGTASQAPALGSPAFGGGPVSLTATGITAQAPQVGAPSITQIHDLAPDAIVAQAPAAGTPALSQAHVLAATELAAQAPIVGAPVIGQVHALGTPGVAVQAPETETPTLIQIHALTTPGTVAQAPDIGAPGISTDTALVAAAIVAGIPAVGTPALSQTHILAAVAAIAGQPLPGAPELTQRQILSANGISAAAPIVGSPTLAGRAPALVYVLVVARDRRAYTVRAERRTRHIGKEIRVSYAKL